MGFSRGNLPTMFITLALLITLALAAEAGAGHNQILNFPSGDNIENYLSFQPGFEETSAISVCAWLRKTTEDATRYWFSYAVPGKHGEVLIGEHDRSQGSFYIQNQRIVTDVGAWPVNVWTHVCGIWDSSSGSVIMVNGEVAGSEDGVKAGASVRAGGNLVLGQEQDSVGGTFDATQSYQGDMYNVNVWNYALSADDVAAIFNASRCGHAEVEDAAKLPYSAIYAQGPQGDAGFVDGSCARNNKILSFPSGDNIENYLSFQPAVEETSAISVCAWLRKTTEDATRYWFSYAVPGSNNEVLMGEHDPSQVSFYIQNQRIVN